MSAEALSRVVSASEVRAVLAAAGGGARRERKLTMFVVGYLLIAMNRYAHVSLGHVLGKLAQGLRYLWPAPEYRLPTESALPSRRYQLGARPVAALSQRVCQPMATPRTGGAFLFGRRLMALDGRTEDAPDTPAAAAAGGRPAGARGPAAFPQVRAVCLAECGTHAIVDAGFWPCAASEEVGARRRRRSAGPGMLVLCDRGLYAYDLVVSVRGRDAHVPGRPPAHVQPKRVRTLPDGSSLAWIDPAGRTRRKQARALVRSIAHTLTDPALPGYGERYRRVATLLSHAESPAFELAGCYHERWAIEMAIDEVATHQRLAGRTRRSLKPVGVRQERYGLLLAHYCIRRLLHEAALAADVAPDRLSCVHALRVLQDAIPEFEMTAPEHLPALYGRLLRDIARKRRPQRRPRSNPRGQAQDEQLPAQTPGHRAAAAARPRLVARCGGAMQRAHPRR